MMKAKSRLDLDIEVRFRYPIFFTHDVFAPENPVLNDFLRQGVDGGGQEAPHRCLITIDDGVHRAHPGLVPALQRYLRESCDLIECPHEPLILPGGEAGKNSFDNTLKIIRLARKLHLCRHSFIWAVGGGAFLDVAGLAAALVHRGVRLIRFPTTVLAQNDSGVGVKNGVNLRGAKNFLGTFAPPFAVFNDFQFLPTLEDRDWTSGLAEAFKVAIIKDRSFLQWLDEHAKMLRNRDLPTMEMAIVRCAELHVQHIATAGDPFEFGSARPLDFGHWCAHKLESLTLHDLRHGEAVAIGMALDLLYAAESGLINMSEAQWTIRAFVKAGLPVYDATLEVTDADGRPLVLQGIEEFREHLGGTLHVTLPGPIGAKQEVTTLDEQRLRRCLRRLREFDRAAVATP